MRQNSCLLISGQYLALVNLEKESRVEDGDLLENILREKLFDERTEYIGQASDGKIEMASEEIKASDDEDATLEKIIDEQPIDSEEPKEIEEKNSNVSFLLLWKPLFFKV